jgi:tRNA dimethylallyltransferase
MKNDLIVIIGPTASGKTKLAANLAFRLDSEIISADSRQVYRGMNIGTGKDLDEYIVEGKQINYHLIDILNAGEKYNVAAFQNDFKTAFETIHQKNKTPILCGGTGMYVDAVLKNYQQTQIPINQDFRNQLELLSKEELIVKLNSLSKNEDFSFDLSSNKRIIRAIEILNLHPNLDLKTKNYIHNPIVFCLTLPAEIRQAKILKRLDFRLKNGLIEEVENLLKNGVSAENLIYYGLEYQSVTEYLVGKFGFEEMKEKLFFAIRQYAKRQMTYFRGMERKGQKINWLNAENSVEENIEIIIKT